MPPGSTSLPSHRASRCGPAELCLFLIGLDCPVASPSTCGRTLVFGGRASQVPLSEVRISTGSSVPPSRHRPPASSKAGFPPCRLQRDHLLLVLHSSLTQKHRPDSGPQRDNTGVSFGLLNIRSLTGKRHLVQDLLTDRKLDFLCLNVTWQLPADFSQLYDSTPLGFV